MALHRNNRTEKCVKTESADKGLYLKKFIIFVGTPMDWKTYLFTGFPQNGRGKRADLSRSLEARQPTSNSSELCKEERGDCLKQPQVSENSDLALNTERESSFTGCEDERRVTRQR
jgi:hypothetical protein